MSNGRKLARELLAKIRASKWAPERGSEVRANECDRERRRRFLLTVAGGSFGAVALGGPALGKSFLQKGGGGGGGTPGLICTSTSSYTTSSSSSTTFPSRPSLSRTDTFLTTTDSSGDTSQCSTYYTDSGTGYFGDGPGASSYDSDHYYTNNVPEEECRGSTWANGSGTFTFSAPSKPSGSHTHSVTQTVSETYSYSCGEEGGGGGGGGGGMAFKSRSSDVRADAADSVSDPRLAHGRDRIVRLGYEDMRFAEQVRRGLGHARVSPPE
jgi:hypothetical protein